jgi:hypothetical protein
LSNTGVEAFNQGSNGLRAEEEGWDVKDAMRYILYELLLDLFPSI